MAEATDKEKIAAHEAKFGTTELFATGKGGHMKHGEKFTAHNRNLDHYIDNDFACEKESDAKAYKKAVKAKE